MMASDTMPLEAQKDQRALRILSYGDSLTVGVTDGPRTPYAPYLQRTLHEKLGSAGVDVEVSAIGFPGVSSDGVLSGLERHQGLLKTLRDAREKQQPFDIVVLLVGTNDFLLGVQERLLQNLRRLHQAIRNFGTASVALGLPQSRTSEQSPEQSAALRQLNAQIGDECGANAFVDTTSLVGPYVEDGAHWSGDGTHLSAEGYQTLGASLAAPLLQILAGKERRAKLMAKL